MGNRKVVLVVEDYPPIREMLQLVLEEVANVVTIPAATGVEALCRVAEQPPDLILLDIMLPELDGLEVARRLKADGKTRSIPIIAVTASSSREHALDAGCDGFMAKPFDVDLLVAKVQDYLQMQLQVA